MQYDETPAEFADRTELQKLGEWWVIACPDGGDHYHYVADLAADEETPFELLDQIMDAIAAIGEGGETLVA